MSVVHVKDKDEFQKLLNGAGDKLVLVDFFATWCGPCRQIAPLLDTLAKENPATLLVLKVDVDENEALAGEQSVSAMPTFKLFKNGKLVGELCGANPDKLKKLVEENK